MIISIYTNTVQYRSHAWPQMLVIMKFSFNNIKLLAISVTDQVLYYIDPSCFINDLWAGIHVRV